MTCDELYDVASGMTSRVAVAECHGHDMDVRGEETTKTMKTAISTAGRGLGAGNWGRGNVKYEDNGDGDGKGRTTSQWAVGSPQLDSLTVGIPEETVQMEMSEMPTLSSGREPCIISRW